MKKHKSGTLLQLLLLSAFAGLVCTETVNLGDLKQYGYEGDIPKDIDPNAIWVSKSDRDFAFVLGKDVKDSVASILKSCKEKYDDECFQNVNKALDGAHVQRDKTIDSRSVALLTTIFTSGVALIETMIAAVTVVGAAMGIQAASEGQLSWPGDPANAPKFKEDTTVTVSAEGKDGKPSAAATFTVYPASTALEGQTAPSIVIAKEDNDDNGFKKGDLAAILDSDLADRLDEFMHRAITCQEGSDFDKDNPKRKRQSGGSYGQALCAAQNVMGGTTHGGAFNDLLHLAPTAHFSFVEAAGPAFAAANQMAEFVTEWAPLIAMPEEVVQQIGTFVLALAIDTIVEGVSLSEKNRIKAESVTATPTSTTKPSSTTTGCPKKQGVLCGFKDGGHCTMKVEGEDDKKKAVCADTELKDCECTGPALKFVQKFTEKQQKVLEMVINRSSEKESSPKKENGPQCEIEMTNFPAQLFSSDESNIHEHFCDSWDKDGKKYSMTVDGTGGNVDPEIQLSKRAPPVDPFTFKTWNIHLSYNPHSNDKECDYDCNDAFKQFRLGCSDTSMYKTGTLDVGCGKFWYDIEKPEGDAAKKYTEVKEFPQWCYSEDDYRRPTEVIKGAVRDGAKEACKGGNEKGAWVIKGDKSTFISAKHRDSMFFPYQYNVWWKEGCEVEDEWDWVYVNDPLDKQESYDKICAENLLRSYNDCTANGGRGGMLQVGCLVYEFRADLEMRDEWN